MTDRGLPIIDGAPACPFVAYDDDREERASGPDARHRCYAEIRPAPRAIAHQDAYCLSSTFALCPTFQDWARRESAKVHDAPPAASGAEAAAGRNPQRGWAAPPPWLGSFEDGRGGRRNADGSAEPPGFLAGRPGESGLAGSLAHQIAMDGIPVEGTEAAAGRYGTERAGQGWPAAGRPGATDDDDDDEADDDLPPRLRDRDRGDPRAGRRRSGAAVEADDGERTLGGASGAALSRVSGLIPRGRPKVGDTRVRRRPGDSMTPSWERPHRYEAYPTLRTRMGVPAVPRVVVLFLVLVLAALGLFFLPGLLGLGAPKATPTPLPVPSHSAGPSFSFTPTATPAPAALTYQVQPGDTMSKIAAKFGVPLTDLINANKDKYPNPDKIVAGDTVTIPSAVPSSFKDATSPVPSTAPKASPTKAP